MTINHSSRNYQRFCGKNKLYSSLGNVHQLLHLSPFLLSKNVFIKGIGVKYK